MRKPLDPLWEFTRPDYIIENLKKENAVLREKITETFYRTEYKVWDCVETLLWDIWYITCVSFYSNTHYKYCIRCNEDKDVRVCEWQIKWRKD